MLNKLKSVDQKLSPGLRKIISNIGWLTIERLVMMLLSLFVGIYIVRYLGPDNYGKLSYSISFAGLFNAIARLGLNQIVIRNLVKEKQSTQEILGTAFVLRLISSVITVLIIGICIWSFNSDPQIRWMTLIIAIGLIFDAFDTIDFWFQSQVLSRPMAIVRSAKLILTAGVKLLFIVGQYPLIAFAWVYMSEMVLKAIGMTWVYYKHHQSIFHWRVNWSKAKELLKDSCPLILSSVMIIIYMRIDQVMLGNLANNEAVGNYAAAVKFSEICYFLPTAICSSVFPAIIRAKQRSGQEYDSKLQQLYDLIAWLSLAVAIPMTLFANTLMPTILGQEYASAGAILTLHIWACPFVFLGVARSRWLVAENFTQFSLATTSLGALTNILLNLYLIPVYGGVGAALATVISYAVSSHVACILYPPMFNNGLMLTKALFVPLRLRQNLIYFKHIKKTLL
ncbi:MAG: flippase [Cyanobacteria bacterium P01_A01_bin.83]